MHRVSPETIIVSALMGFFCIAIAVGVRLVAVFWG
jgi:hypothetical protein